MFGLSVNRFMHMFQLNSYKPRTHLRWLRRNLKQFWTQLCMVVLMPVLLLGERLWVKILFVVVCLVLALFNRGIKSAKVPFKYTPRVVRMLVVCGLVYVIAVVLALFVGSAFKLLVLGTPFVISPLMPVLANSINSPLEHSFRQRYIKDAKRILDSHSNLIVIGVTGSYGKTTVKYFLATLLKAKYSVLMTPESYNTPMGVVKTIREELRPTHQVFVCEMGARHRGDIAELCQIVRPKHGVVTAIGEQHLETFGTQETIVKTKFELAEAVAGRGVLFVNGDSPLIMANLPDQECFTYGLGVDNACCASDIRLTSEGTEFSVDVQGVKAEGLRMAPIGEHNVVNVAGAIAVCNHLGILPDQLRTQLTRVQAPPHRLQLIDRAGMLVIDDSYNSNPSGCAAALKTLGAYDGLKILITPGMVELGAKQSEVNRAFGRQAAQTCDLIYLVGEENSRSINEGLQASGFPASNVRIVRSLTEAIREASNVATDKRKVVLLENDLPDNFE